MPASLDDRVSVSQPESGVAPAGGLFPIVGVGEVPSVFRLP